MTVPITITRDTLLVQAGEMPHGEIDDELMVLDSKRGEILGLDKIGTEIWRLTASPMSVWQLAERLELQYDADAGVILTDLLPFLAQLVEHRLLRITS